MLFFLLLSDFIIYPFKPMKITRNIRIFDKLISNRDVIELTHREWDVLLCVSDDLSNAEIADNLCLSVKSVENYRTRIGCKLNVKGSRRLARFARMHYEELRQWYQLLVGKLPPKRVGEVAILPKIRDEAR